MNAYLKAQQAQRVAADPAANVFVTANAGSGKTKVLVDRIARLLLAGAKPASFLCITYTKAAASEMQRRLFKQLGGWCVASDADLRSALCELRGDGAPIDDAELPKARALFAQALETPGGLKIQTIHAFCERLLARFPLEAGAPPGFDIADEPRAAAMMAAARGAICAAEDHEVIHAFTHFAAKLDSQSLEDFLGKLAAKDVQADADALRARHEAIDSPAALRGKAASEIRWDGMLRAAEKLSASSSNDQKLAEAIRAAGLVRDNAHDACSAYLDIFYTKAGGPKAKVITDSFRKKEPGIARLIDDEAQRIAEFCVRLKAAERAEDAVAAHILARALALAYAQEKARAGALDFTDLIAQARALLEKSAAAPWVLYKLDGGIDHILIDEGQDTSPDQWALVAPLQDEFFSGAGASDRVRTVFAVGDPKQSIYSFQGADPKGFLDQAQALGKRVSGAGAVFTAPTLEMSFRSTPDVLRAVDAAMEGVSLSDGPMGEDVVRHSAKRETEQGLVEVWPIAPKPQSADAQPWDAPLDMEQGANAQTVLAQKIARSVKEWIARGEAVWENGNPRPMRAGDVLALVRSRGPVFSALIKAFKREGLPVAGADRMTLREELAVEDCLALMRVALDPADDLSLACVLKGPWLSLLDDDNDLFPLAHGRASGQTLYARLMESGDARFDEAKAFVSALVARAGEDAFGFISWTLEHLDGTGRSGWLRVFSRLGPEARDPLEELLERALAPGRHAAPTLQRFLADIEADSVEVKREMESGADAIRVMTVHGAKGLEAPVVILPDMTGDIKKKADGGLLKTEDGFAWSPSAKEDDSITARARAEHIARAEAEHWRLLYVAMTRARDRLIMCGFELGNTTNGAHADSWHTRAWNALAPFADRCETPFGEGLRLGAPIAAERRADAARHRAQLPEWALTPLVSKATPRAAPSRLKAPAPLSPRSAGQKRFQRGRLIHGLMERLPDLPREARGQAAAAWLNRMGVIGDEAAALWDEARAVLDESAFAAVFGPGSRAEVPLCGEVAGRAVRGVVDRLIVSASEIFVLDFKSDRPAPVAAEDAPAAYVLQMALYRAVLVQIFPNLPVRCALLWTERPALTELKASQLDAALEDFRQS